MEAHTIHGSAGDLAASIVTETYMESWTVSYRISNIPAPFLSLLLWADRPDPDKSEQSSIEKGWIK